MNRHRTVLLLLAGMLLAGYGAAAAGPDLPSPGAPLTLEQAIDEALRHNRRLLAARSGTEAAEAGADEARSGRLPRLVLQETASRSTQPALVFGQLLGQETFGPQNFDTDFLNEPDALNNFRTTVGVEQPVWTAGRLRHAIRGAEAHHRAARAREQRTRGEVVHQAIDGWTRAAAARSGAAVARRSLETARAHRKLVQDLHEGGLVVRSDVLQAEVRVSEVEEMLVRAEAEVRVADAALNLTLGRPAGTPVELAAPEEAQANAAEPADLDTLVAEALRSRADLDEARRRGEAAGEAVRGERAARLPEVGVSAAYEANAEDFVGADGTNWSVFLGARLELFDGGARRARVRRARAEESRAGHEVALLEERVTLEVYRAAADLEAAVKRVEQAARAVAAADEGLGIIRDRYREGLTTLVELLDAETALTSALDREVRARRDRTLSRASLDLALGRLR